MNASNPPSDSRLREIFLQAAELTDAAQRRRFLDDACAGEAALRAQINDLLASHQDDSFLEHPAIQMEPTPNSASGVTIRSSAEEPKGTRVISQAGTAPEPGTKLRYFGDYELLDKIAQGGMCVVYKARQVKLNRTVAVKMILAGKFATEADVKRFHTEAEAAANLQHPNIVAIHEVGEHEGKHYFSMDYVEGRNLADFIKDNPLPAARAAQLIQTMAEAIHFAHQRGTLHRDLKPHNVLIDAAGQPRLTDFGLAKRVEKESGLTLTGAVMGTPSYMPPEQAAGKNDLVGPPSDVYSIGAMLYHLLTGRAPFVAETPLATLRKVMEEEPVAPSKLNSKTPSDLETICLKCLEKKPERRYATARVLAEELGRFLNHEPILAKPASPFRKAWSWSLRNPWIITAAASALILGLVGLAYYQWQQTAFLNWKLTYPNQTTRHTLGLPQLPLSVHLFFIYYIFLIGFPYLDLMHRLRRGHPILRHHLAAYSVIGSLEVAFGIFLVLNWAEALAWQLGNNQPWLVFAFALSTIGMWVVWEAACEHFSAISGLTGHKPPRPDHGIQISWKTAPIAALNEMFTIGVTSEAEYKIGPVTALCGMVVGSLLWITVGASWVVACGWLWAPPVVNGVWLTLAMALWAATKGAARFFWACYSVTTAGVSIWPVWLAWCPVVWPRPQVVNFEGWIIGVAAGLFLVKVLRIRPKTDSQDSGSPEATEPSSLASSQAHGIQPGSFEVLRFLAAWAALAIFFALLGPNAQHSRSWLPVVVGASSLSAAAWCLSLRRARTWSVILLVLILLFGSWIIFASPYAIPFTLPGKVP